MSITALAVEALPVGTGDCALAVLTGHVDTALDGVTAARVVGVSDPLELARWARAAESRLSAFRLSALAEAERQGAARRAGALGTAAWLKGHGEGAGVARRDVALAGALADPDHERTRDSLAAGRIGAEQAHVVTAAKDALSDAVGPADRAAFEAQLLEQAESLDPWQLRTAAKRAAARVDPTGSGDLARVERETHTRRDLVLVKSRDEMYTLTGRLDAHGAATLAAALDPLAAPRSSGTQGRDTRTPGQRLADALVDLAKRQLTGGQLPQNGGLRPRVVVTMTLDQLRASNNSDTDPSAGLAGVGAAEIVGGYVREPISASSARRIACDSGIIPAVLGGDSAILDFGKEQRTATPAQRHALALRDKGCTGPGCGAPPSHCEAHHIVPFRVSQRTRLNELTLVCGAHHDMAHQDDWTITIDEHGRVSWTQHHLPPPDEPPEPDEPDPPDW